jgi:hypothetical protein
VIHKSSVKRRVTALVVVSIAVLASGASAAAATGPAVRGVASCTEELPFGIEGSVTGLEPNTSYGVQARFSWGGSASTIFTTDSTGSSGLGGVRASSPFEVRVVIWLNPDGDFDQDAGEPTVLDQTLVVDRACEDARLKLPTSKDQCKNGGWRAYGVFRNQGDCDSYVATKGKNPPANSP